MGHSIRPSPSSLVAVYPSGSSPSHLSFRTYLAAETLFCAIAWWTTHSSSSPLFASVTLAILAPWARLVSFLPCMFLAYHVYVFFTVPAELAHLPRVPLWPLIRSYARGESEHVRIVKLILPFAEAGHGVVLVWTLGRWMLSILRSDISRAQADKHAEFPKESPPDGLLLWTFSGKDNIQLSNGTKWRNQQRVIKSALGGPVPIRTFSELATKMMSKFDRGGRIPIDVWAQRMTLEVLSKTALGYEFNSLDDPTIMERYNAIMDAIASPLYALFPTLETLWPRTDVYELIASFHHIFDTVISEARAGKAGPSSHGMLSLMLSHDQLSEAEIRDNLIVFFLAGHDSTAATLSSVMYYLSVHPELQARARDEAIASFGNCDPMDVADFEDMPYGLACIREALRLNPPFLSGVPRICEADCRLGDYAVPAHTSFISNVYAMHHSSLEWEDPFTFRPERYLENGKEKKMPDEWLAFLSGPRQCSGRTFALYELRTALALLLREFQWTLPSDSIHRDGLKNAFSGFGFNLPYEVDLDFTRVDSNM